MLKYRCQLCQREFLSTRPESETLSEYAKDFPQDTDKSIVCNSCGNMLMAWYSSGKPVESMPEPLKRLLEQYSEATK